MDRDDRSVSPRRCPACDREEGQARSVTLQQDYRTIGYVCGACDHEWQATTMVRDPLFLGRASHGADVTSTTPTR